MTIVDQTTPPQIDQARREEIAAFLADNKWYQSFLIVPGIVTPGLYDCLEATKAYGWPDRMDGLRFLDCGSNAGFYVCHAKRLGAARAVGIDRERGQIEKARRVAGYLGVEVEFRRMDFYELPSLGGTFEWVQCLNLFHHLRRPWDAMRLLSQVCTDTLIWEGIVLDNPDHGKKGFRPVDRLPEVLEEHHSLAPTTKGILAMFREVGFSRVEFRTINRWKRLIFKCRKG